jgi:hypothetical protein
LSAVHRKDFERLEQKLKGIINRIAVPRDGASLDSRNQFPALNVYSELTRHSGSNPAILGFGGNSLTLGHQIDSNFRDRRQSDQKWYPRSDLNRRSQPR